MHTRYCLGGGALIAALFSSTASFADVTPEEVWTLWKDYMGSYGYSVTSSEDMSGGNVVVSDLTMSMDLPEDGGSVSVTFGELAFTDAGGGTVAIEMPASLPVSISVDTPDAEDANMVFDMRQTGLSMIASGSVDDMTLTYSAASLSMVLADLVVEGETVGTANLDITMTDLAGNSTMAAGDMREVAQTMTAKMLSYDFGLVVPEEEGNFFLKGQIADLNAKGSGVAPTEIDIQDMAAAMKAGFAFSGDVTFGAGNSEFSFKDHSDTASGSSNSQGGSVAVSMDAEHLRYGVNSNDVAMSIMGSEIPFPINLSSSEMGFDLTMPVAKSETPQDFALLIKMVGFAPDAMIWGMLDPTSALPHDPADLVIDLAGKANWFFDIMDPEQQMAMESEVPGEIHALTLKDLRVSAAGAVLTGMGDFTFDNSDLETFDGLPAPEGTVDLRLVGANGLLDKLIAMGLMSEDDAMGARMMMGLFGRPGEGEDELLSTIEVKKTGEISANGQRLQ